MIEIFLYETQNTFKLATDKKNEILTIKPLKDEKFKSLFKFSLDYVR